MTTVQQIITIAMCAMGTMATRFLPFLIFRKQTPAYVRYLGDALPPAVFGMLVVYCLKGVSLAAAPHGIPELLALLSIFAVHVWKKNSLLSMAVGTAVYMFLVQKIF